MKNVPFCRVKLYAMFRGAENIKCTSMRMAEGHLNGENELQSGRNTHETDPGLHEQSYPAVFTALSVGANGVSLEGACGGVAAWVHTFLE